MIPDLYIYKYLITSPYPNFFQEELKLSLSMTQDLSLYCLFSN